MPLNELEQTAILNEVSRLKDIISLNKELIAKGGKRNNYSILVKEIVENTNRIYQLRWVLDNFSELEGECE